MKVDLSKGRGIKRKMDNQSRLIIPIDFRRELNIKDNDTLEIILLEEGIYIKKCD